MYGCIIATSTILATASRLYLACLGSSLWQSFECREQPDVKAVLCTRTPHSMVSYSEGDYIHKALAIECACQPQYMYVDNCTIMYIFTMMV